MHKSTTLVDTSVSTTTSYSDYVNPQWVALLDLLDMNVRYERCEGAELFTDDGRRILDFLSGYCVHNTGHNHPHIVQALQNELEARGPVMLQSHVPELAGELGKRLCDLAGGGLRKVFFCSSGSEGVEAAIKFARMSTRRDGWLCAKSAFHGLTGGELSLMSDAFWREGFGPLLADARGGAVRGFGGVGEATKFQAIRGVCCGADTVGSGNQNSAAGIFEGSGGNLPADWNIICSG